jgi:hypothetical protein
MPGKDCQGLVIKGNLPDCLRLLGPGSLVLAQNDLPGAEQDILNQARGQLIGAAPMAS